VLWPIAGLPVTNDREGIFLDIRDHIRPPATRRAVNGAHEVYTMKWIRYSDLVAKGIVNSRMTLKRLIDLQDFPPGVLIRPNARAWDEAIVDAWVASRPAARKPPTRKADPRSGARVSA
jgi:predicted DNA-binding transcriptional regulator AlpA